ncbi:autotransporter outer membrane beta-barrel domain-containing protein, partial [Mesorhizobium sp. IMUNJ 23232]|uniref:autotransporter outer membrane beta-barrel domain-containing protein n=2 Tax=Mesorhizobium TaxID=68287 RepID=UPI00378815D1
SPGASQAMAAAQPALARGRLDGAMRCPADAGTLEVDRCVWGGGSGTYIDQIGAGGYDGRLWSLGGGGQFALGENWIVGGAAGIDNSDYHSDDGFSRADGTTGYVAAAVGRQFGGFSLTGAVAGSWGAFDTSRSVVLPGFTGTAEGDTDVATLSGRVRAAYTFAAAFGYVRPTLDVDLVYTHSSGYTESGAGIYNLDVAAADQTALIATPSLEVGTSFAAADGWAIGGFATVGLSLSTEDEWTTSARLEAAPLEAGRFATRLPIADIIGEVGLGLSVANPAHGVEARVEYEGSFGNDYASHGGLLRLSKRF